MLLQQEIPQLDSGCLISRETRRCYIIFSYHCYTIIMLIDNLSRNSQELKAAAGQAAVRSVQFSPDNQKLLTASDDKAVKVFVFDCLTLTSS